MIPLAFLSFGFSEILLVGVVALLVFGGDLPDVMRSLGRSYAKLRRSLSELARPVRDEMSRIRDLPEGPPPPVGPAASNVPTTEYPEYEPPEIETPPAEPDTPNDSGKSGSVADEPPPV